MNNLTVSPANDRRFARILPGVLLASFLLNTWGITWGLPAQWHPGEITGLASTMVDQRSLNPHYFAYGPLHYYEVMLFAVVPAKVANKVRRTFQPAPEAATRLEGPAGTAANSPASPKPERWWSAHGGALPLARLLSGLLGTATVALVWLIAKTLFDPKTALIAAALVAVSMGPVVEAHFSTVDTASAFWFTLAVLMSVYVWSRGTRKWYVLAGLTVGLAAAVKYVGGLALITLIVAHLLNRRRRGANLLVGMLMVAVGFLIGTPVILFSFFEFIDGFTKEFFFNTARERDDQQASAFLPLLATLKTGLGLPLFLLALGGVGYSIRLLKERDQRPKVALVWSMFLPYYLSIGSHDVAVLSYTVPLVPFLSILSGKLVSDLSNSTARLFRVASGILLGGVIGYSLLYAIAADLQLVRDSRYQAVAWVRRNVPSGSKIEVAKAGGCVPAIPENEYAVVQRPESWNQTAWINPVIQRRDANPAYALIRKTASALERLLLKVGFTRRGWPYKPWYEQATETSTEASREFDLGPAGLESRRPDYLILCRLNPGHFVPNSDEFHFYSSVFSGKTSYQEITQFKFRVPPWLDAKIQFVNPTIYLFGKRS